METNKIIEHFKKADAEITREILQRVDSTIDCIKDELILKINDINNWKKYDNKYDDKLIFECHIMSHDLRKLSDSDVPVYKNYEHIHRVFSKRLLDRKIFDNRGTFKVVGINLSFHELYIKYVMYRN